jgi:GMP synthase-like glutamine amidotransferase
MKFFDFNIHIQETIKNFKEDNVDYYLILACKKQGNKRDQAGFFYFPALIPGIYRKNSEKWLYLPASSELPGPDILNKIKAVIIPGSELSVYMDVDFLRHTEEWIRNLIVNYPEVKFLGLCFGMQLFITAIGGKVESMGEGKFVSSSERLDLVDEFWNFEFVKKSNVSKRKCLNIRQAHGDHVTLIPELDNYKLKTYASSDSCGVEIVASDDEKIFGIQGHPEYATEFSICRAAPWYCIRNKIEPSVENLIMMKEKMLQSEKYVLDTVELRKICNSFLKN